MREIVLDTETTGLDPLMGDRVVEIAALELVNHMPTGNHYHVYLNPERDVPAEAFAVHGLSAQFLADKPLFATEADAFLAFIGNAPLVIHNGAFDLNFLNAELARLRRPALSFERLIDTLLIARKRFPGAPASLDALCRRFGVDLAVRRLHGALVDCQLLAAVYLEMVGGRQPGLMLAAEPRPFDAGQPQRRGIEHAAPAGGAIVVRPARRHSPTVEELERHRVFVASVLKDSLWLRREAAAS